MKSKQGNNIQIFFIPVFSSQREVGSDGWSSSSVKFCIMRWDVKKGNFADTDKENDVKPPPWAAHHRLQVPPLSWLEECLAGLQVGSHSYTITQSNSHTMPHQESRFYYTQVLEGSGRTSMSLVSTETEVLGGQRGRGAPHDARGWTPRDARRWTHWRNRRPAEGSQHGKTGDFGAANSGLFLNCSRCFPAGVHPLPPDHPWELPKSSETFSGEFARGVLLPISHPRVECFAQVLP